MIIKSNLHGRDYSEKEVVRIYNRDQQTFYVNSGVYPIDLYPSYNPCLLYTSDAADEL